MAEVDRASATSAKVWRNARELSDSMVMVVHRAPTGGHAGERAGEQNPGDFSQHTPHYNQQAES